MTTGIVILNYNDNVSTKALVDSIKDYESLNRILVVDNCSTDDSFDILRKRYSGEEKVEVICSDRNGGYSYGNNFGANYLIDTYKVDIIMIANPDVWFEEKVVFKILDTFENNPEYAVLAPVMTRPDNSVDKAPYRELYSYSHDLFDSFLTVRRLIYEKKKYEVDYTKPLQQVEVIQGSFFAIRSEIFRKIGGLDDKVFLYYEEMILGKKLKNIGMLTGLLTDCTYLHNHSTSIVKSLKRIKIWRAVLKSKYYYQKEYNNANFIMMFVLKLFGAFSVAEKIVIEVFRKK